MGTLVYNSAALADTFLQGRLAGENIGLFSPKGACLFIGATAASGSLCFATVGVDKLCMHLSRAGLQPMRRNEH